MQLRQTVAVTKYKASNYNSDGHYQVDEWTSYSDIGKVFDGKRLSKKDYLLAEDRYVKAAELFMQFVGADEFVITHLYQHSDAKTLGIRLEDSLFMAYQGLKNYKKYPAASIKSIVRLALRECAMFTIKLKDKFDSSIEFGFDYYMYFASRAELKDLKHGVEEAGMSYIFWGPLKRTF